MCRGQGRHTLLGGRRREPRIHAAYRRRYLSSLQDHGCPGNILPGGDGDKVLSTKPRFTNRRRAIWSRFCAPKVSMITRPSRAQPTTEKLSPLAGRRFSRASPLCAAVAGQTRAAGLWLSPRPVRYSRPCARRGMHQSPRAEEIILRDDGGNGDLGYPWATMISKIACWWFIISIMVMARGTCQAPFWPWNELS